MGLDDAYFGQRLSRSAAELPPRPKQVDENFGVRKERANYPLHPISTLFEQKGPEHFAMVIIRTRRSGVSNASTTITPQNITRVAHVKLLGDAQLVLIVRTVRENSDDPFDHYYPVENGMTWEIR